MPMISALTGCREAFASENVVLSTEQIVVPSLLSEGHQYSTKQNKTIYIDIGGLELPRLLDSSQFLDNENTPLVSRFIYQLQT